MLKFLFAHTAHHAQIVLKTQVIVSYTNQNNISDLYNIVN